MATQEQIDLVRLNIADEDGTDFTDAQITYFIDLQDSVNYASYQLIQRLIPKLRKQLLEKDTTGVEGTSLAPVRDRLELLKESLKIYKDAYNEESGGAGIYIETVAPTIAGGDI